MEDEHPQKENPLAQEERSKNDNKEEWLETFLGFMTQNHVKDEQSRFP